MTAPQHVSALKSHCSRSIPSISNRRLASLVAFMVALQSPTLASTHQRSNGYRPTTNNWRESPDNYRLYPFESQQIYYSEDEVEERILSALERAESEEASESSCSEARRRRRRGRKRKRKRRRPQDRKTAVSSSGEEGSSNDALVERQAEEDVEEIQSIGTSLQLEQVLPTGNRTLRLATSSKTSMHTTQTTSATPQKRSFASRVKEVKTKLQDMKEEEKMYENPSSSNPDVRSWGASQSSSFSNPNNNRAAFVTSADRINSQPPRPNSLSSGFISPPQNPRSRKAFTKVRSRQSPQTPAPASRVRAHLQPQHSPSSTSISRRQTMATTKTKPKPTINPSLASSNKRPTTTLTSAKDSNVSPWIRKFHSTRPKDCLVLVPRDYLLDNFNLARLAPVVEHLATLKQKELEVSSINLEQRSKSRLQQQQNNNQLPPKYAYPIYRQALELILRQQQDYDTKKEEPSQVVQYAAEVLYTLVHARFVVSPRGLETIRSRLIVHGSKSINQPLFGRCPRLGCGGMPLLPCGMSDDFDSDSHGVSHHNISNSKAKRYCCNCRETFHCWESKVDGSAWGTSVCHLLLMVFGKSDLFPSHFATPSYNKMMTPPLKARTGNVRTTGEQELEPGSYGHIFGFPIHPSAPLS